MFVCLPWESTRSDKKISKKFQNAIDNQLIVWYDQITIQGLIWKKSIPFRKEVACMIPYHVPMSLLLTFEWNSLALPLLWFGIIVLTLIVESQTADLVAIWFAPGAFVSMILSFFNVQFWVQFGIFIGLTVIGLILSFAWIRPMMKKRIKIEKTNAEALAGKLAMVEEDVNNAIPTGVAKINGQLWTARMENPDDTASQGEWVEIVRVEGSKLICRPKP
jgi:membrane protein implicated in regulation of membrane protease activity